MHPNGTSGDTVARTNPLSADPHVRDTWRQLARRARRGPGVIARTHGTHEPNDVDNVLADPQDVRSAYQPIIDLRTGVTMGFEALARWPRFPTVDPAAVFLAAADRHMLLDVDWAARLAGLEGALDASMTPRHALFLNIEPDTLDVIPDYACEVLRRANEQLNVVLELTERSLLSDPGALLAQIRRARSVGCRIALDDVGAHPDSLTLLEYIAPEIIKLDRALVARDPSRERATILSAVRSHVDATGAVLLAEGIETTEHLERAQAYGCVLGQGWMFGRPGPLPDDLADTDPGWELPARRTAPGYVGGQVPAVPSELFGTAPSTVGRKSLIIALTQQIEQRARASNEPLTVISAFQDTDFFTPVVAEQYRQLAERHSFVAALGVGIAAEPAPGVRGAELQPDEPFVHEWTITVVGHHHFAALIARDLGDSGPDSDRRFEFLHTYDRELVVTAARSLMCRVLPELRSEPMSPPHLELID